MLFNSIEFLIFLPIVFVLYWFVFNKHLKKQNLLILISSYIFYGWWDYRFLSLIILSTIVDYIIGLNIPKQDSKKKHIYYRVECLNKPKPVQINIAPNITNVKLNAASAAAPTAINIALRTRANKTPIINTFW